MAKAKIFRDFSPLYALLLAASTVFGVGRAIREAWVCDDAFISFRFALNLVRGNGLVFNAGEYVEGYTNFLWTLWIAAGMAVGADPLLFSKVSGIVCYAALLFVCFRWGSALRPRDSATATIPLILPAIALHDHLHVFATSGLETPLFTLAVTAGVLFIANGLRNERTVFAGGFAWLSVACLSRPDGLLVYGLAAMFVFVRRQMDWRDFGGMLRRGFASHAVFLCVFVPAWLFRFWYYGDVLPNTFYAKSAYEPYAGQGLVYAGLYFASYWVFLAAPAILLAFVYKKFVRSDRVSLGDGPALVLLIVAAWIAYVIWVGGDFMFARFWVPVSPLLFLLIEAMLRRTFANISARATAGLALMFAAATLLRYDPYRGLPLPIIQYVGEEQEIYTPERVEHLRNVALKLKPAVQAAQPVIAFVGAQAGLMYYLDVDVAIEAQTGLTDRRIARMTVEERGWVGHEKNAPLEYLRERNVDFILRPPPPERRREDRLLRIEGLIGEFEIVNVRREVLEVLRRDPAFDVPEGILQEDVR